MTEVLAQFFDIALAVASAAATAAIFVLLAGQIAIAHKYIVRYRNTSRPANAGQILSQRTQPQ
ncbi:hypothetical protein [Paraburkholderia sp.]|jgi:hypothetical protein|uniref:hypothetical protein n=1 Tax=Paraburkholderia sp. TaxID=1926495 RepID=UPI002F429456